MYAGARPVHENVKFNDFMLSHARRPEKPNTNICILYTHEDRHIRIGFNVLAYNNIIIIILFVVCTYVLGRFTFSAITSAL